MLRHFASSSFFRSAVGTLLNMMPVLVLPLEDCLHLQVTIAECFLEVCCELVRGVVGKLRPVQSEDIGVLCQLDWRAPLRSERVNAGPSEQLEAFHEGAC